ncbi:hypothetical protein LO80_08040 [Candidatus Francisella endociliophora]|uniref:Cyanophycinase n=1 Tax=Candidatus Francisella endociliophora TaxID=653937 RepID=A0A097EQT7_9GAMM|nr:hypothetical protein [Francisella sp. FSC1006]AIT09921.1 hypothetical protein LO80_08040 [Francisella sp. FSC1006]
MKKIVLVISIVLLFTGYSYSTTKKVFLVGGNLDGTYSQIFDDMASAIDMKLDRQDNCGDWNTTKCPKVAVITSAADNSEIAKDKVYPYYKKLFEDNGFITKHVIANVDNYTTTTDTNTKQGAENARIIKDADIIFFNGGNQTLHSRTWLNDDGSYNTLMKEVAPKYNSGALMVGTSAGMAVLGDITFGGISDSAKDSFGILFFHHNQGLAQKSVKDGAVGGTGFADQRINPNPKLVKLQHEQNGGLMSGLSLLPFEVITDTHFGDRGRLGRLISAMSDSKKHIGLGIDQDNTALLVTIESNDTFNLSAYGKNGSYIVSTYDSNFDNGKGSIFAKNIRLDYLSNGDVAKVSGKNITVIPANNKKAILTESNNQSTSNDILSPYAIFDVISSLSKSSKQSATGKTNIPAEYPTNTPIFEFLFTKDNTKSYCIMSDNKCLTEPSDYTIENLYLDIESKQLN